MKQAPIGRAGDNLDDVDEDEEVCNVHAIVCAKCPPKKQKTKTKQTKKNYFICSPAHSNKAIHIYFHNCSNPADPKVDRRLGLRIL